MPFDLPELPKTEVDQTSQEYVYARLRHAIMVGAIPVGASLTMRGLAEQLGLSPTPIREALRRLSSENAIAPQDNRRMLIPEMTPARFEDLLATRIALEGLAAERALPHVSGVIIDDMRQIDQEMDAALTAADFHALTRLNYNFHARLYRANPNHSAMALIESIWLQLGPFHREVLADLKAFYQVDRHKEILGALDARDGAALASAIRKDIEDGVGAAGRAALASRS